MSEKLALAEYEEWTRRVREAEFPNEGAYKLFEEVDGRLMTSLGYTVYSVLFHSENNDHEDMKALREAAKRNFTQAIKSLEKGEKSAMSSSNLENPHPVYSADVLIRIARTRLGVVEMEMSEHHKALVKLGVEHGKLYTMVKAYEEGNPAEVGEADDVPNVTIGSANIRVGKGF